MINLSYYEGALTARVNKFTSRGKMGPESVPNPLVHSEEGDGGPGPSRRPTVWSDWAVAEWAGVCSWGGAATPGIVVFVVVV